MASAEDVFKWTTKTKAALDLAEADRKFRQLLHSGMDRDEAWKRAFLGIYTFWVPADIPEPDDPALLATTYQSMDKARLEISGLLKLLDADLLFLKRALKAQKAGVPA